MDSVLIVPNSAAEPLPKKSPDTNDTSSCGSDAVTKQSPPANTNSNEAPSCYQYDFSGPSGLKPAFAKLEPELAKELAEKTEQRVEHALMRASVAYQSQLSVGPVPKFTMDDVTRFDLLGAGGFASVYSIEVKEPQRLRYHKRGQEYVIKHLSPKLLALENKRKLHAGAKDIVLESHLLSALNHRNIIAVHGMSEGGISSFATQQRTDSYFMILPRLNCTLADKISAWKRLRNEQMKADDSDVHKHTWWRRSSSSKRLSSTKDKHMQQALDLEFLCERLQIVIDLCQALEYLHSRRIMHRDIKPPNVGFDREGTLKLFDFGLAKELPPDAQAYSCSATNLSKLKTLQNLGNTGTTRYMAPEVIRREPYDCKVDVFAASIVTWEIMTLKKPYGADVSGQFVKECVALYDDRPSIPSTSALGRRTSKAGAAVWPKALKKLVQQGWTKDIDSRLTAKEMRLGLLEILSKKRQQQSEYKVSLGKDSYEEYPSVTMTTSMSC